MRAIPLLAVAVACAGAGQSATPGITRRVDFGRPVARFDLPGRLAEVSGLTFAPDGRLLAHGDERGLVYAVDVAGGTVDRGFQVGDPPVVDDLEGMATAGERIFMASSAGRLYEFRAVPQGGVAPVRVTDLGVGADCEVEGIAHHPGSDVLLVACKTLQRSTDEVRILQVPLSAGSGPLPPIRVPLSSFRARGHRGAVNPSGIDVDPATGTLVVLAARQELLFEVDLQGRLLDMVRLPARRHPQPEGIVFGTDGRVYVADEAAGGTARITVYGPPEEGAP